MVQVRSKYRRKRTTNDELCSFNSPNAGVSYVSRIKMKTRKPKQMLLAFRPHGGAREGAGRKPAPGLSRMEHAVRPRISGRNPLHVTLRAARGLPSLRERRFLTMMKKILAIACLRFETRVVQFSIQRNHLHLIVEAGDWLGLSRAIKGLSVRIARAVNRMLGRSGAVFADRHHARELKTPLEVRNALVYVLQNAKKHGDVARTEFDPCSSAAWFTGWAVAPPPLLAIDPPVAAPRTWLLRVGWLRHGLIRPSELPQS